MRNVIAIFYLAFLLAACGADSNYVGKWYGKTHNLEFLKDGTALLTSKKRAASSISTGAASGNWKTDDNGGLLITISVLGSSQVIRGQIKNGDLLIEEDVFTRTEPVEVAEPVPEPPRRARRQARVAPVPRAPEPCKAGITETLEQFAPGQFHDVFVKGGWRGEYFPHPSTGLIKMCSRTKPSLCWEEGKGLNASWVRVTNVSDKTFSLSWKITCPND